MRVCLLSKPKKKPAWQEKDSATSLGTLIVFIVVFLLLQFCTNGQLLQLKLLAFLFGTLHILLFIPAYCANKMKMMMILAATVTVTLKRKPLP